MQRIEQNTLKAAFVHLKKDVAYPATKDDIMTACNNFEEIPASERDWFYRTLPDREYSNAEEVVKSLIDEV